MIRKIGVGDGGQAFVDGGEDANERQSQPIFAKTSIFL
jgi:hypothetical protein